MEQIKNMPNPIIPGKTVAENKILEIDPIKMQREKGNSSGSEKSETQKKNVQNEPKSEAKSPQRKIELPPPSIPTDNKITPKKKRPNNPNSVLVKGIPEDLNTISSIDGYFKKFGKITNISVDTNRKTALIRFESQDGAIASKNSTDPIMGNPAIRLVYEPPTPIIAPIHSAEKSPVAIQKASLPVKTNPKSPEIKPQKRNLKDMRKDYEKMKRECLEKSTQKIQELIKKLNSATSEEEKTQINKTIDAIKAEMKNITGVDLKISPPVKKEKPMTPPATPPSTRKKYEAHLENIVESLQNYGPLIAKLKVILLLEKLYRH